jgi:hypothetical protein
MKIIKETKYLCFINKEVKLKTKIIGIMNKNHGEEIGLIKWFSKWRQYCFFPTNDTVWNTTCIEDIYDVISDLMDERKK